MFRACAGIVCCGMVYYWRWIPSFRRGILPPSLSTGSYCVTSFKKLGHFPPPPPQHIMTAVVVSKTSGFMTVAGCEVVYSGLRI
jgi:hypothetical protein